MHILKPSLKDPDSHSCSHSCSHHHPHSLTITHNIGLTPAYHPPQITNITPFQPDLSDDADDSDESEDDESEEEESEEEEVGHGVKQWVTVVVIRGMHDPGLGLNSA